MSDNNTLRIAFIIDRLNTYRMLASLIAEGLNRGHFIECWHMCSDKNKQGDKGHLYPSLDKARFNEEDHPNLTLRGFDSLTGLTEAIATRNDVSHIVAMEPAETVASAMHLNQCRSSWCVIMYGQDTFRNLPAIQDKELSNTLQTIFYAYTPHLFDFGMKYVKHQAPKAAAYLNAPNVSVRFIGNAMLDPIVHNLDKVAIRKKYGIPTGKNIALYLPYGYLPAKNYKKSRSWQSAFSALHIKRIAEKAYKKDGFIIEPIARRLSKKMSLMIKVLRDPLARKWIFNGWHEPAVIDSVRQFCDKNDLFLVVKPRRKFDFSEAVYQKADLLIGDEEAQYYPSMMQELLSVSSIGISFFSWAVLEFVYQGVPIINIECMDDRQENPDKKYWHSTSEGFIYNSKGNVWNNTVPSFLKTFHKLDLQDFKIDQEQRTQYFKNFLGNPKHSAAELFYDDIEGSK
ncbi:MAG TPA: hypothetical protein DEQ23_04310 [Chlorobium sp.]|uniref:Uncharacterized protein n=1 Tax=Chlorobium phaeovibrioides (strain DSM 265 / 1930) TaxID=290318 RepID=A4SDY3_CHLPM|nr:hypothetical protein [Chlorobium sp.]